MQWWTPPSKPTKGRHSTALSISLGQTFAEIVPSLLNMVTKAFSLLLCCAVLYCYEAVSEAVPHRCCVVTQLEGEVYKLVTLVSLPVIDRDGINGKQCGLA